jgi:hypothetical protein
LDRRRGTGARGDGNHGDGDGVMVRGGKDGTIKVEVQRERKEGERGSERE